MRTFNFNYSVVEFVNFVENAQAKFWEQEKDDFPNSWGGCNALIKRIVGLIIDESGLPYSKELGSFVRMIVEYPNTWDYVSWKRSLVGKTIEEVVFDEF